MIDLIPQLNIDANTLTPESKKWYDDIMGKYHAANNPGTDTPPGDEQAT
jgi:hypothetical protein